MNLTDAAINLGLGLVAPLLLGWGLRFWFRLPDVWINRVMMGNVFVLVTLLSGLSLWAVTLDVTLIWLPFIAVASSFGAGLLGRLRGRGRYADPASRGSYVIAAMISNRNTAGTLLAFLLLGEAGYAYSRLIVVMNWPFLLAVCYPLARRYQRKDEASRLAAASDPETPADTGALDDGSAPDPAPAAPWWRRLLNPTVPPILGMIAGLALNLSDVPRPEFITPLMASTVMIHIWLFLVPLGHSIDLKAIRGQRLDPIGLGLIKFIATPGLMLLLGWLAALPPVALATAVILGFSPSAIQAVVTARLFKLNHHLAMGHFVVTMLQFLLLAAPAVGLAWAVFDLTARLTP